MEARGGEKRREAEGRICRRRRAALGSSDARGWVGVGWMVRAGGTCFVVGLRVGWWAISSSEGDVASLQDTDS